MIDANEVAAKMVKAGEEWADLDAAANFLEETKGSYLSMIMNEAPDSLGSIAAKEAWARKQVEYKDFISNMVEARRKANRARVKWVSIQSWTKLMVSEEVSRRAEMSLR